MKVKVATTSVSVDGANVCDCTKSCIKFFHDYNIDHVMYYDAVRFFPPFEGIEVKASTIGDVQDLAKKYQAHISFTPWGDIEIEFVGD